MTMIERMERLDAISRLEDGFRDGFGVGPSSAAVANAARFIQAMSDANEPFSLYPMESGGVEVERRIGPWDLTLAFANDMTATLSMICHDDPTSDVEVVFQAVTPRLTCAIMSFIRAYTGETAPLSGTTTGSKQKI